MKKKEFFVMDPGGLQRINLWECAPGELEYFIYSELTRAAAELGIIPTPSLGNPVFGRRSLLEGMMGDRIARERNIPLPSHVQQVVLLIRQKLKSPKFRRYLRAGRSSTSLPNFSKRKRKPARSRPK